MNKIIFLLCLNASSCIVTQAQETHYGDSTLHYYRKSNFGKAIYWGEKNVAVIEKTGRKDTLYGTAMFDLGMAYYQNGQYAPAIPLFKQAAEIYKMQYDSCNATFIDIYQSLAATYQKAGNFVEAEHIVLEIIKGHCNLNTLTEAYAESFILLGVIYKQTARFFLAEETYKRVITLLEKASLRKGEKYANALNALGILYYTMGKYKEAESFIQKAVAVQKEIVGENHWAYANLASNLAALYSHSGNINAAIILYKKILPVVKNQIGETHPMYAGIVGNLATTYYQLEDYKKAEPLMLQQLGINEKAFGSQSEYYAVALNNLGNLYLKMGISDKATSYFEEAFKLRKTLYGETDPRYAQSINNLALLATHTNNFKLADSLYQKAVQIIENNFGKIHPDYLIFQNNYFESLQKSKRYGTLAPIAFDLIQNETIMLKEKLNYLSTTELQSYLLQKSFFFLQIPSALHFQQNDSMARALYDNRLFAKGIAVQNFTSLSHLMETSSDSLTTSLWKNYKAQKVQINKLLTQPLAKRTMNADSLSLVIDKEEKQLLDISAPYSNVNQILSITWQDIQKALAQSSVAIEFIRYRYLNNDNNYVFRYAAMLLRKQDSAPLFVDLCNEDELLAAIKKFAYRTNSVTNTSATKTTKTIYQLIWQPLQKYLTSCHSVYFSPDGLLYEIAFAAIPITANKLLADRYQLVQLTSTRQLAVPDITNKKPQTSFLFGGINYNQQRTDTTVKAKSDWYAYVYQQNHRNLADSFSYLPGSLQEVKSIAEKLKTADVTVYSYTGANASESNFRQACNNISPTVLHFATHGFALPDITKQQIVNATYTVAKNPLLRTGLVMAAGNRGWKGQNNLDEDDGILTGLEIAAMQLPNTQLAVLSACETAKGEIRGSEGVFGLQRAFKLAGVNYIMASLWQVPDVQTNEFMTTFYKVWLKGNSIQYAFYQTQLAMRKKHSPYYWAGFTLVK